MFFRKLSKYETLQMALSYIEELGRILKEKPKTEDSEDSIENSKLEQDLSEKDSKETND